MISPIAIRLERGTDLKQAIQKLVHDRKVTAGTVASCVGCLSQLHVRLAGAQQSLALEEPLEIVSLMGTLTPSHQHIHISVSKQNGEVIGGHLLNGSIIDTTAELVIHSYTDLQFDRAFDPATGYTELTVSSIDDTNPTRK